MINTHKFFLASRLLYQIIKTISKTMPMIRTTEMAPRTPPISAAEFSGVTGLGSVTGTSVIGSSSEAAVKIIKVFSLIYELMDCIVRKARKDFS